MGDGTTEINKAGEKAPMSSLGLGNPAVNIKACILNTDTVSIIL